MLLQSRVGSLGWEDPLEEGMPTPLVFLPGKSHGQKSLVGRNPQGLKKLNTTAVTQHARMQFYQDFSVFSVLKNPFANAGVTGDMSLIPGSGISPGEGSSDPLQYFYQDNLMDRETW